MAVNTGVAFIFPGQGAQFVGMGRDVYEAYPEARAAFEAADKALGFPLTRLCFEGPEDELRQTVNVQPAIVTLSLALLAVMRKSGWREEPGFFAGHSLGEYSALTAAGVLAPGEAILLARRRGQLMQDAGQNQPGTMAAVLGLDDAAVVPLCEEAGVYVANYNCPGQVVISGALKPMEKAIALAEARGARKVVPLQVSGAFHTPLMQPAAAGLAEALAKMTLSNSAAPIVANSSGAPITEASAVRTELVMQLTSPVQWQRSVEYMASQGVRRFVEIGPGKVLAGLVKRISREAETINVGDAPSLQAYLVAHA
jgi:[acyl-carrier-protein] S-malonyltransferase